MIVGMARVIAIVRSLRRHRGWDLLAMMAGRLGEPVGTASLSVMGSPFSDSAGKT